MGERSDMTSLTVLRQGTHVLPIVEKPELVQHWIDRFVYLETHEGINGPFYRTPLEPLFWAIHPGSYASWRGWGGVDFHPEWLIKTSTGRRLLILEADSTNSEEGLVSGQAFKGSDDVSGSVSTDLTLEDATLAFRHLELKGLEAYRAQGITGVRSFKVFLGDSLQRGVTGAGREYYLRDRALNRQEIDVFIDSRVPVLKAVLKWAEKVTGDCKVIYFETTNQAYFRQLQRLMGTFGFTILGNPAGYHHNSTIQDMLDSNPDLRPTEISEDELQSAVPRLIYYSTSAQSVEAAFTLCRSEEADAKRCCVVVDKYSGHLNLENLSEKSGKQLSIICPALIYDDLMRQVRVWARQGYSASTIQAELDHGIQDILGLTHKSHIKIKPLAKKEANSMPTSSYSYEDAPSMTEVVDPVELEQNRSPTPAPSHPVELGSVRPNSSDVLSKKP